MVFSPVLVTSQGSYAVAAAAVNKGRRATVHMENLISPRSSDIIPANEKPHHMASSAPTARDVAVSEIAKGWVTFPLRDESEILRQCTIPTTGCELR